MQKEGKKETASSAWILILCCTVLGQNWVFLRGVTHCTAKHEHSAGGSNSRICCCFPYQRLLYIIFEIHWKYWYFNLKNYNPPKNTETIAKEPSHLWDLNKTWIYISVVLNHNIKLQHALKSQGFIFSETYSCHVNLMPILAQKDDPNALWKTLPCRISSLWGRTRVWGKKQKHL